MLIEDLKTLHLFSNNTSCFYDFTFHHASQHVDGALSIC